MEPLNSDGVRDSIPDGKEESIYLANVINYLLGQRNSSMDFAKPHLRPSFATLYPLFVFLYAILVTSGFVSNVAMIISIVKDRLYHDQTYCYLINLALANTMEALVVIPVSLMILLVQNWIFGSFLCFFLPMLQDIPIHVTTLTMLLIAWDRHRFLKKRPRIPAFVFATGAWLGAICLVLPYPIYTTYLDLGKFYPALRGVGLCAVNLQDDMQEYARGLFIALYVLPLILTAYLYVRMSQEIQNQDGPIPVMMYDGARSRCSEIADNKRNEENLSNCRGRIINRNSEVYEAELNVAKEKRTHKYLGLIATVFAICLCPLMVLRVAKLAVVETYENTGHFDITYIVIVWIAFWPIMTTPVLYFAWRMNKTTKERLRGYLRLSGKHQRPQPVRRADAPVLRQKTNDDNTGKTPQITAATYHKSKRTSSAASSYKSRKDSDNGLSHSSSGFVSS